MKYTKTSNIPIRGISIIQIRIVSGWRSNITRLNVLTEPLDIDVFSYWFYFPGRFQSCQLLIEQL
ncbi:MAG: hypothetical protein F6K37_38930 [Moorea sp. SIO4E2]|uniref:hypothetical protein n=1 Tax=Moorena sp. SIO4E2 TaxID=2607826 RepID=UPI0013B6AF46|nr:hypothetical protein [Moorena sp. SIO4E2]NEQ11639.1 hypothetical protein [Moorena sp. SIO4E2]